MCGVNAFGGPINVATVGTYAATPTAGMTVNDATSNSAANGITLANFKTLMTASFAGGTGGDIDFEDQTAGGTINPTYWRNNGTSYGDGAANQITATFGIAQSQAVGIYRSDVDGTNTPMAVNGSSNNAFVASGTSYLGIVTSGSPVNLVFTRGLSALGFTAVPRSEPGNHDDRSVEFRFNCWFQPVANGRQYLGCVLLGVQGSHRDLDRRP